MVDKIFTLTMHHGGCFVNGRNMKYIGGKSFDKVVDADMLSILDIDEWILNQGYVKYDKLWYQDPKLNLKQGLRPLTIDNNVMEMCDAVKELGVINVYVENCIVGDVNGAAGNEDEDVIVGGGFEGGVGVQDDEDNIDGDEVAYNASEDDVDLVDVQLTESDLDDDRWFEKDFRKMIGKSKKAIKSREDKEDSNKAEGEEGSRHINEEGSRDIVGYKKGEEEYEDEDEGYQTEELDSMDSGDEDNQMPRLHYPIYKQPIHPSEIQFEVGMQFNTLAQFKKALKDYAIYGGFNVQLKKNDKQRVKAKCQKECKWEIYVSKFNRTGNFHVKTFKKKHTCYRSFKNKQASSDWLASTFLNVLKSRPTITLKEFVNEINLRCNITVARMTAFRAKAKALEMLHGTYSEQYAKLRDYCEELIRSNPGTTVKISVNRPSIEVQPVFQRLYVCMQACKEGFKHCRPIIGVDGCFLKGPHGGQLLTAVGRDGNEQMFPIAFAVVEQENKDSWSWFINLLLADIGGDDGKGLVFISDQQKGLKYKLEELGVEHRNCVRHMYNNFQKIFKGGELKEHMWRCAKATNHGWWKYEMKELKKKNENAYKWLKKVPTKYWCRHAFSPRAKCDTVVNNICETFNGVILEGREMKIISMVEWLRMYLLNRFTQQREVMKKYSGPICPKVQARLEVEKSKNRNWIPNWSGETTFQAIGPYTQFSVDLSAKYCSCGFWELTGIPCQHAICGMRFLDYEPEDYVHQSLRTETFLACYKHMVYPTNSQEQWPETGLDPILPPPITKTPGRPKKLRRKEADELKNPYKMGKKNIIMTCSRCGGARHNKRTCRQYVQTESKSCNSRMHGSPFVTEIGPSFVNKRKQPMGAKNKNISSKGQPTRVTIYTPTPATPASTHTTAPSSDLLTPIANLRGKRKVPDDQSHIKGGKIKPRVNNISINTNPIIAAKETIASTSPAMTAKHGERFNALLKAYNDQLPSSQGSNTGDGGI